MGRATRGCGCAAAVLITLAAAAGFIGYKFVYPRWKMRPPAPSGSELQVHVLDVGPINGDSILIISPAGKSVLVDAGDTSKSKNVLEALKRYKVEQIDYFIVTHPHPDHLFGLAVLKQAFPDAKIVALPATVNAGVNKEGCSSSEENSQQETGQNCFHHEVLRRLQGSAR